MRWSAVVGVCALVGCGGAGGGGVPMLGGSAVPRAEMAGACRVGATQAGVIVTEWAASEKANLEAMTAGGGGGVAVELSGCEMRIVAQCQAGGEYQWRRTTPSRDTLEINDRADLQAKLPLGAVSLSGELQRSGTLLVETTVAGQRQLLDADPARAAGQPGCERATHIVNAVALGAFALRATGQSSGAGAIQVAHVGSGGGSASQTDRLVRSAGAPDTCAGATDDGPAADCASPVQVFLTPIPGRAEEEGPAGTIKVDFLSADHARRWDVYAADEALCSTPCTRWVDPQLPVLLKERKSESFFEPKPDRVQASHIGERSRHVQLRAHATRQGRRSVGIVFTALGGMTFATGATLLGIGCIADAGPDALCPAGIITGVIGAAGTAAAIYLIATSGSRLEIRPVGQVGRVTVDTIGPGFVSGRF